MPKLSANGTNLWHYLEKIKFIEKLKSVKSQVNKGFYDNTCKWQGENDSHLLRV